MEIIPSCVPPKRSSADKVTSKSKKPQLSNKEKGKQ